MRSPRAARRLARGGGLLLALAALALAPRRVDALAGHLEPGIALAGDECLLPIALRDGAGAPYPARLDELSLTLNGRRVEGLRLGNFAPALGGEPCRQLLLLDLPALDASARRAWAERLAAYLEGGPGLERELAVAADGLARWAAPGRRLGAAELDERLAGGAAGSERLWDALLAGLAALSAGEAPARRAILLVSDGQEGKPSRHPLASCLEAAKLTRVPVYVLALPGPAAGGRRLAELAAASGGQLVTAESAAPGAQWGDLLTALASAQALRFRAPRPDRPLSLQLEVGGAGGGQFAGTLAPRTRVAAGADSRLLYLLALPLLAGIGAVIVWQRRGGVGRLQFVDNGIRRERVLPHRGLSIGSDPGSDLLVAHPHVSRQHAVLRLQRGQVLLTDLRSTNGTAVNGQPVRSQILRDGDRILLGGSVEIVFTRRRSRARTQ